MIPNTMTHKDRVRQIDQRLAGRPLIYFGTRGADARPLLALESFSEVFCQVAPLQAIGVREACLESITKRRVDLNRFSIDQDTSEAVESLRRGMLQSFGRPAALMAYRPTALVASAWFPRADRVLNLSVFHEHQSCFEHKPWVETQLAAVGVKTLPWSYFSDNDLVLVREAARRGPLVLRTNRSDGGVGLTLVRDPSELEQNWPTHIDGFLAASRYLAPSVPLNVNGCVFADGEVSVHAASLQLIGLPMCTSRIFGYCGNDFAQVRALGDDVLNALEQMTQAVGAWLSRQGYLGAFGIDALLHDGQVRLVELNPRFQGSSRIAAELDVEIDRPDLFLNHLAAFLGLPPPPRMPLRELVRDVPPRSHLVCHNLQPKSLLRARANLDALPIRCDLIPASDVAVEPEAVLVSCLFDSHITEDGTSLRPGIDDEIRQTLTRLYL